MAKITLNPGEVLTVSVPAGTTQLTLQAGSPGSPGPVVPPVVPTVSFASSGSNGAESVTAPTISVRLSSPATVATTVKYAVTGGTAVRDTDYTLADGTLTFAIGDQMKALPLTIASDIAVEVDETIIITLSAPVNATLGTPSTHTYTIVNDDIAAPASPAQPVSLGVNIEELVDWSRTWMLVNVAKHWRIISGAVSGAFTARIITSTDNLDSGDAHGSNAPTNTGDWLFECTGNVTLGVANATISNRTYNSSTGKTTATITVSSNSADVDLTVTPASGASSGWKIHRPGYALDTTKTFTDEFKRTIAPFRVIRLMDYLKTNRSVSSTTPVNWSDRTAMTSTTWNGEVMPHGGPIELAVQLANETGKDLWFNIPDLATTDYVTQLAAYMKANLSASCKLYLEFSNEVWNDIFAQCGDMRTRAATYRASAVTPTLDGPNTYYDARQYTMLQLVNASLIFRSYFGSEMMTRIRPVFCDQIKSSAFVVATLNWLLRKYPQPPSYYIWGIAGAPYYGPIDRTASMTEMLTGTTGAYANLNRRVSWANNSDGEPESKQAQWYGIAQAYGVALAIYECGWDAGQGLTNLDAKIAASYNAASYGLTLGHIAQIFAQGAEVACYFNLAASYTRSGQWGLTDDVRQEGATSGGYSQRMQAAIVAANSDIRQLELAALDYNTSYFGRRTDGTLQSGTGLIGSYYRGTSFATLIQTRIDKQLNFSWRNYEAGMPVGVPDVTDNATKGFSVRWRGSFIPRYTGSHKFTLETTSDSVTFTLNAQNMLSNDTISLTAGTAVPLVIDFVPSTLNWSTNGKVRLWVEVAGGRKTLVQQSCLRPT